MLDALDPLDPGSGVRSVTPKKKTGSSGLIINPVDLPPKKFTERTLRNLGTIPGYDSLFVVLLDRGHFYTLKDLNPHLRCKSRYTSTS